MICDQVGKIPMSLLVRILYYSYCKILLIYRSGHRRYRAWCYHLATQASKTMIWICKILGDARSF